MDFETLWYLSGLIAGTGAAIGGLVIIVQDLIGRR
jgi:hypothetical protein